MYYRRSIHVNLFILISVLINVVRASDQSGAYNQNSHVKVVRYCEIYGKTIGTCSTILDCQPILELFKSTNLKSDVIKNRLAKYFCGYNEQRYAEICCPFESTAETVNIFNRFGDGPLEHPNLKLLLQDYCGPPPNSKFSRGGYAELTDYPWAALLKYDNPKSPYLCGGSLINNRYILTSAQCVNNKHKLIGVRLGEYDMTSNLDCISIVDHKFCKDQPEDFVVSNEDVTVHQNYNADTLENDIALIRLRNKVKISDFITPVCLPITQSVPLYDTGLYSVVGWGVSDAGVLTEILKYSDVVKANDSSCNQYLKASHKSELTNNRICTNALRTNRGNACVGDKGGALINAVEDDIRDVQYGIVSAKPSDCFPSSPLVYTKVSSYINWILDNIKA